MTGRHEPMMEQATEWIDMRGAGDASRVRPSATGRKRRRRGRVVLLGVVIVLLLAVAAGGYLLVQDVFGAPDYPGAGVGDVVVQVQDGDTTTDIGNMLLSHDVVASAKAFTNAASGDDRIRSVQPGYYQMRLRSSGDAAVGRLLDPASRVGQLEIRGGTQLDDTRGSDAAMTPGVLSLLAKATCAQVEGRSTCITADELRATMSSVDPAELGVPDWATAGVRAAAPGRRLEGLLAPGRYDIEPGRPAAEVIRGLVATSAARIEATGLASQAEGTGYSPYQLLVIASLVEKEGIAGDFGKISRVIQNRLLKPKRLELDSTVNYPLDLQALRTTANDRARPGPYNTYLSDGLPPTPISAVSPGAVAAALGPEPGPWLYFVRCRADGTSCFAGSLVEHQANVAAAEAAGAI